MGAGCKHPGTGGQSYRVQPGTRSSILPTAKEGSGAGQSHLGAATGHGAQTPALMELPPHPHPETGAADCPRPLPPQPPACTSRVPTGEPGAQPGGEEPGGHAPPQSLPLGARPRGQPKATAHSQVGHAAPRVVGLGLSTTPGAGQLAQAPCWRWDSRGKALCKSEAGPHSQLVQHPLHFLIDTHGRGLILLFLFRLPGGIAL